MNIPIQIDVISIARATNAARYEYLDTVQKRTETIRLENELWQRAVEEFRAAFEKEDAAFKQYRASLKTSPLKEADKERDKQYAALRDAVKAYAKFPILISCYCLECSQQSYCFLSAAKILKKATQTMKNRTHRLQQHDTRSRTAHPDRPAWMKTDYISLSFILVRPSPQLHKGNLHTLL